VTAIAGTTRDLITEPVDVDGLAVTLVDTAGSREAIDAIEQEGVARGARAREVADLVIVVLDIGEPLTADDQDLLDRTAGRRRLVVVNKVDREARLDVTGALRVSATHGDGIEALRSAIRIALSGEESLRDTAIVSNMRHVALLQGARGDLDRARHAAADDGLSEEFLLVDLQAARARFDEIVGARTSDDVLRHIFERFCIGK
jgi:tRNA modification GTPase